MKTANSLDYCIIGIYMLAMLGIGFAFMRFNKGASDYFRGGNRIPWLVSGLSCFMSGFSAWTFTGAAGIAYRSMQYILDLRLFVKAQPLSYRFKLAGIGGIQSDSGKIFGG